MLKALKALLESNVINEDTQTEIMEAWESKLSEAREELRTELREEFAQRYDHDKTVMVSALDKMVTEGLKTEIVEFNEEKALLAADRVTFQKTMSENYAKFNNFMTAKLAEEIRDLRKDRIKQMEGLQAVESFVAKKLATEITEFAADKRDLVETKVALVAEAKVQLKNLKKRFVAESALKVQNHVKTKLRTELSALQEDIQAARENAFGREIFETFASTFMSTHLNENAEIRKLKSEIANKDVQLTEAKAKTTEMKVLTESKEKQIRTINATNKRTEILGELLGPLNTDKREIMQNLLENIQTARLSNTFEKYLPAVLANKPTETTKPRRKVITESRKEVTGDKTAKKPVVEDSNIIDIKKLAGL